MNAGLGDIGRHLAEAQAELEKAASASGPNTSLTTLLRSLQAQAPDSALEKDITAANRAADRSLTQMRQACDQAARAIRDYLDHNILTASGSSTPRSILEERSTGIAVDGVNDAVEDLGAVVLGAGFAYNLPTGVVADTVGRLSDPSEIESATMRAFGGGLVAGVLASALRPLITASASKMLTWLEAESGEQTRRGTGLVGGSVRATASWLIHDENADVVAKVVAKVATGFSTALIGAATGGATPLAVLGVQAVRSIPGVMLSEVTAEAVKRTMVRGWHDQTATEGAWLHARASGALGGFVASAVSGLVALAGDGTLHTSLALAVTAVVARDGLRDSMSNARGLNRFLLSIHKP